MKRKEEDCNKCIWASKQNNKVVYCSFSVYSCPKLFGFNNKLKDIKSLEENNG